MLGFKVSQNANTASLGKLRRRCSVQSVLMFFTTLRKQTTKLFLKKLVRRRASWSVSTDHFWIHRSQKQKTGTNGMWISEAQRKSCGYFWKNNASVDHSRQHRLPKSKLHLAGELSTAFRKRTFKNIFSCNIPPPHGGEEASGADFRASPYTGIKFIRSQEGQPQKAAPPFFILPFGIQADPQADNPVARKSWRYSVMRCTCSPEGTG